MERIRIVTKKSWESREKKQERRRKTLSSDDYVSMRIEQLKEDRDKASNQYDKMWYSRLIQELSWVSIRGENCSLESLEVI